MTSGRLYSALYSLVTDGILKGLSGTYVDDIICAGDCDFKKLCLETDRRVEMTEYSSFPSEFTGFVLDKGEDGSFTVNQNSYFRNLECLSYDDSFGTFRSMRMKPA